MWCALHRCALWWPCQARQQLESSLQRSRADVAAEGEHRELMEKVQHLNLLRESNVVLRAECESHAKSYQEAKRQLEDANKKVRTQARLSYTAKWNRKTHHVTFALAVAEAGDTNDGGQTCSLICGSCYISQSIKQWHP